MLKGAQKVDNGSFKTQPFWNSQNGKLRGHSSKVRRRLIRRVPLISLHSYYNITHYKLHITFHTQKLQTDFTSYSPHARLRRQLPADGNDDSCSARGVRAWCERAGLTRRDGCGVANF